MKTWFRTFLQRLGLAVVICAVWVGLCSEAVAQPLSVFQDGFDTQLHERLKKYLDSVRTRVSGFSPEYRDKVEKQVQSVVRKGFLRLEKTAELSRKERFAPVNLAETALALRRLGSLHANRSLSDAQLFLCQNFRQPTERDIIVYTALPSRCHWERIHGVLAQNFPFGGVFFGMVGPGTPHSAAIIPNSSGRTVVTKLDCQSISLKPFYFNIDSVRFDQSDNLLIGFPSIAQTIVLRN